MINSLKFAAIFPLLTLFVACGKNVDTKDASQIAEGTKSFSVTATNAPNSYTINGIENPKIIMVRGATYTFNVRTLGHPFYIMFVQNVNPANQYTNGISGNGVEVGPLTFAVPSTAPETLYYMSSADSVMYGIITIKN